MSLSTFEDLDIDAITGTELFQMLGLSSIDLANPSRFTRLQQVIDYLKQFPEDTRRYMVSKVTSGKAVDKLDKVFEYTQLMQRKSGLEKELDTVRKEGSILTGDSDPLIRANQAQRELATRDAVNTIQKEIEIYEK
jgi:hypothetical protein